jgi:hypothetical protein
LLFKTSTIEGRNPSENSEKLSLQFISNQSGRLAGQPFSEAKLKNPGWKICWSVAINCPGYFKVDELMIK